MVNSHPLAKLHDIHLPQTISWWPPALGWYLIIAIVLLALGLITLFLRRKFSSSVAKKEALKLLAEYQAAYQKEGATQLTSANVSALLKRVALVYYPRASVASLQGKSWLEFLTSTSKNLDFNRVHDQLLLAPYRAEKAIDLQPLFDMARHWINQRRKPCLN